MNNPTNGTQQPAATAAPATFTEAPASFNIKCYNPDGFDCMITVRSVNAVELLERAGKALDWLKTHGFSPTRQPLQPASQPPQQHPADPTPAEREAELRQQDAAPRNRAPQVADPGELTFMAEKLAANMTGGKTYWKVFGGRFSKFGVTIWPEVLNVACAANLINCEDELDPRREYQLTGLTACYIENEGKPQKVTRLIK